MTTIGYATLQIIPSLVGVSDSINKQLAAMPAVGTTAGKKIGKELEAGVAEGAEGAAGQVKARLSERLGAEVGSVVGRGVGGAISTSMTAAAKIGELALKGALIGAAGAAGVAAAAVGGVGLALTKGFDRLKSIDEATFKLKALGHSAGETKAIMDDALASVKGTAFSLGDAATAAASAVAAGIKPGQDLKKYLTEVGDAASVAGTSFEDMGHIFNKVQTQNKAYTDDLQMLSDRGVPIFTWLQQEYGVTADALTKMVQGGQVDAAHFQDAIEKHIGGAAKTMGQSFAGSVDNAEAALGRLGAALLKPLFNNAAGGIGSITGGLDHLTDWVNAHQPQIIGFFTNVGVAAVSLAQDMLRSFASMLQGVGQLSTGLGSALDAFGIDNSLSKVGESLDGISNSMLNTANGFDSAKDKIRAWGATAAEEARNAQNAVGGAVTGISTAVGALPFKKVIGIDADTKNASDKVVGIGNAVGALKDKTITVNVKGQLSVNGQVGASNTAKSTLDGVFLQDWIDPSATSPPSPPNPIRMVPRGGGRAAGGTLPGYSPGVDNMLVPLSGGEGIVIPEAMRALGPNWLYSLNSKFRGGLSRSGYAGGGVVGPDVQAAEDLVGTPYSMAKRFDCSGDVARVINAALGIDGGGLMTTANAQPWLAALGFKPGIGGPGTISVGWKNGGPGGGHMAMTLSDGRNAEGGGSHPNFMIGGAAAGASSPQFTDHMYLALAAAPAKGEGKDASGQGDDNSAAPTVGAPTAGASTGASLPSSLSGLSSFGLSGLGKGVGTTGSGSDLSLFGNAAASAVSGQVSSALGAFGIDNNPPILQAASQLLGGISIGGQGSGGSSAAPLSARSTATGTPPPDDAGNVHGTRAGQAPGPQVVYNIRTATVEDAFTAAQRKTNERALAKLSAY